MAFTHAFLFTLVVDMLCIASLILPGTSGLMYRAFYYLSLNFMSVALPCLMKARSKVLLTCHLITALYVALHWEDWTSLTVTVDNVVNCFVPSGRSGGLQAVQFFQLAPHYVTPFNVTLVSLALVLVWVANRATYMCTTKKVREPVNRATLIHAMQ